MATYLVTRGCGFIGSHLCKALLSRADAGRVLDDLSTGSLASLPAAAAFCQQGSPPSFRRTSSIQRLRAGAGSKIALSPIQGDLDLLRGIRRGSRSKSLGMVVRRAILSTSVSGVARIETRNISVKARAPQ
jgi:hypothetical protein